jgi:hypothetical protein
MDERLQETDRRRGGEKSRGAALRQEVSAGLRTRRREEGNESEELYERDIISEREKGVL